MANFGFIPVSLSTLYPTDGLGLDLYIRPQGYERPVLFSSGAPLQQQDLSRLEETGITKIYIRRESRPLYQEFLREHLDSWLNDAALPLSTRAAALNEVVRDTIGESFKSGKADAIVGAALRLGQCAARLLVGERVPFAHFARYLHHDHASSTHAANVCYYAVLLAAETEFCEADQAQIAAGALLHDLGMLEIDDRILTKDGRLEETESRQIRLHPANGFSRLCRRTDLSVGQLMMVYQHHERLDGSGYPVGIDGGEIHPWAKICAVVDVFAALTSHRPYRRALAHQKALEIMCRDGRTFDLELVRCWESLVGGLTRG
ncbi:MAG TPA: HD domain-containing phosphohydrolase [Pirellulaceae bacterium]|nr:HD domain-containing phosphohydrolase [Pirellulaceae bacterium]